MTSTSFCAVKKGVPNKLGRRIILCAALTALAATVATATTASAAPAAPAAAAPAAAASAAEKAAGPNYAERMERGKQIASAVCVACHGLDGYSPISANPNIGGMPSEYIAKQLDSYKSGKRANTIMQGMAANLTPADMKALGDYYFAQRGKSAAVARSQSLADRGKLIYRAGIAESKVPACSGCHGATGAGLPAQFPKLAGQWPEYTLHELKEYASGERNHAMMTPIAKRMKAEDLVAVAEYIAGMRAR
jgi:cytochrome c553